MRYGNAGLADFVTAGTPSMKSPGLFSSLRADLFLSSAAPGVARDGLTGRRRALWKG
jgi:hypothetical protein